MKEISNGNTPLSEEELSVDGKEFDDAVNFLVREKYLIGVEHYDDRPQLHKIGPELTEKGEKYLEENSTFSKTYRGLKEIRDWLWL
ncbi:YjcQ family protein [Cohnella abietis]|uniref:YjcQ protein n=1 Tax=Cohnella abietis TaxID=2507935 RepID=A0A3T1D3Q5_9BACL|nr:YjcQ family protein [Cohnella abietis]BBI32668.1 hypothetical protein KCTCHS21_20670 [Cohnella abietis]